MADDKITGDMAKAARARAIHMLEAACHEATSDVAGVAEGMAHTVTTPASQLEALVTRWVASNMRNVLAVLRAGQMVHSRSVNRAGTPVLRFADGDPTLVRLEGEPLAEYLQVMSPARLLAGLMALLRGVAEYSGQIASPDDEQVVWADLQYLCETALQAMDKSQLARAIIEVAHTSQGKDERE
jgi:hypothetical protein